MVSIQVSLSRRRRRLGNNILLRRRPQQQECGMAPMEEKIENPRNLNKPRAGVQGLALLRLRWRAATPFYHSVQKNERGFKGAAAPLVDDIIHNPFLYLLVHGRQERIDAFDIGIVFFRIYLQKFQGLIE